MPGADDPTSRGREREPAFAHLIPGGSRKRLAALVRQAREEAELSQGDLAARLGVFQSVLSKIEAGEREVTALELWAICRALGVPPADFMRRLEEALDGR